MVISNSNKADKSNSGSAYCKMSDGTLIQWGRTNVKTDGTTTDGTPWQHTGSTTENFAISFISVPVMVANVYESAGYWTASVSSIGATVYRISLGGYMNNIEKTVLWIAIGRWK